MSAAKLFLDDGMSLLSATVADLGINALYHQPNLVGLSSTKGANVRFLGHCLSLFVLDEHLVNHAVGLGFLSGHPIVAVAVGPDFVVGLA